MNTNWMKDHVTKNIPLPICMLLGFIFCVQNLTAQEKLISVSFENEKIETILFELAANHQYDLIFHKSYFSDLKPIHFSVQNQPISAVLNQLLDGTNIRHEILGKEIILKRMRTIYGVIKSDSDHEALINAAIYLPEYSQGTYSNIYGYFSFQAPFESKSIKATYVGFQSQNIDISTVQKDPIVIYLQPLELLDEVIVVPIKDRHSIGRQESGMDILPKDVGGNLSTGGEPDINQFLYRQSGVSSGPDGFGGLHVRGGNSDQNLILLDGVRIFQPNHAFGLFSIFNPSLLKNAKFSKYNFDTKYTGGVSSILEMNLKEGSTHKWNGNVSVSTLATQAMLNGPLVKDKMSLLLSFRRSHIDLFVQNQTEQSKLEEGTEGYSNYYFYDLYGKIQYVMGPKDRIFLSFYNGKDVFEDLTEDAFEYDEGTMYYRSDTDFGLDWRNRMGAIRWNHIFGDHVFSNVTLSVSDYEYSNAYFRTMEITDYLVDTSNNSYLFQGFLSYDTEMSLHYTVEHFAANGSKNTFGISLTKTALTPGVLGEEFLDRVDPSAQDIFNELDNRYLTSAYHQWRASIYGNHNQKIGERTNVKFGCNYRLAKTKNVIYDTTSTFHLLDLKLGLDYQMSEKVLIAIALAKRQQGLHLLTSSNFGFPNDLWVPANGQIKPQNAWHFNLLLNYNVSPSLSFRSSLFYKRMDNIIRFPADASQPSLEDNVSTHWEEDVITGSGNSKGVEFDLKFNREKWSIDLAYTLSKYERVFEKDSKAKKFPFIFDQTHNLSFKAGYQITPALLFYSNFSFNNGLRQTLYDSPTSYSPLSPFSAFFEDELSETNGIKLPAYNRLDIGLVCKWGNKVDHSVVLGVQNVYNRKNVYYQYFLKYTLEDEGVTTEQGKIQNINALPFLPTLRWSMDF